MGFVIRTSVIRLKSSNLIQRAGGYTIGLAFEAPPSVWSVCCQYRELRAVGIDNSAHSLRQTPDQLVETGTHVVIGVSDREANVVWHVGQLELENMPLILKIVVLRKRVGLLSSERFEQGIKSVQMLLRSANFQERIG